MSSFFKNPNVFNQINVLTIILFFTIFITQYIFNNDVSNNKIVFNVRNYISCIKMFKLYFNVEMVKSMSKHLTWLFYYNCLLNFINILPPKKSIMSRLKHSALGSCNFRKTFDKKYGKFDLIRPQFFKTFFEFSQKSCSKSASVFEYDIR